MSFEPFEILMMVFSGFLGFALYYVVTKPLRVRCRARLNERRLQREKSAFQAGYAWAWGASQVEGKTTQEISELLFPPEAAPDLIHQQFDFGALHALNDIAFYNEVKGK